MQKQWQYTKMKKLLKSIKNKLFIVVRIAVSILSVILLFLGLRWAGIKGFIMLVFGMIIMGYLLLSKNMMLDWFVNFAKAKNYLEEIKKK